MTTLTLEPSGSAVKLTLTPSETIYQITRSDPNGNAVVRVPAGTFPRTTPLEILDWEAALGTPVTYTAATATGTITLTAPLPVLVAPLRPSMSQIVEMVTDYSAPRVGLSVVHQVQDRPDPLISLGRLATRSGSLKVWAPTFTAARAIENMIDRSGVVFLKQIENSGQDMYFTANGTAITADQQEGWNLDIDYQEITRPISPINEGSWTFSNISTSFASFSNVTSNYDDFEGLSLNDQTGVV